MPIYEFVCIACSRKSSFLTRSVSAPLEPVSRACGSTDLRRALSGFAHHHAIKDVWKSSRPAAKQPDTDFYKGPRNIGRNMEETFRRWDMDIPKRIRVDIDAAREGTLPEGIDL